MTCKVGSHYQMQPCHDVAWLEILFHQRDDSASAFLGNSHSSRIIRSEVEEPGNIIPRPSATADMVEAVPITLQAPAPQDMHCSNCFQSSPTAFRSGIRPNTSTSLCRFRSQRLSIGRLAAVRH